MEGTKDWYAALGTTKPDSSPADTGVHAQAAAQPADNGAQVQELAMPADNTDNNEALLVGELDAQAESKDVGDGTGETGEGADKPSEMSKEERAKFAARRREAETQTKIDAALAEERQKNSVEIEKAKNAVIASLHLVNPATQKPITTQAEYADYERQLKEQRINENLGSVGIDPSTIMDLIDEHPAVVRARQLVEETELEKSRVLDTAADAKAKEELNEIRKYDPTIEKLEDLFSKPYYAELRGYVQNKLTISQAYYLVNRDAILEKERKAAAQGAINSINSKQHLQSEVPHGTGGIEVPKGVEKGYGMLYGKSLSPAELRTKYEKTQK